MSDNLQDQWVMVPREPTEEMVRTAFKSVNGYSYEVCDEEIVEIWAAMLAAAPQQAPAAPPAWAMTDPKVWPYLYAFADEKGDFESNGPYILATEWEGQALRLAHIREDKDLLCYAYVGKWPPVEQPVQAAPGAVMDKKETVGDAEFREWYGNQSTELGWTALVKAAYFAGKNAHTRELEEAYDEGFNISAEGWNGEYGASTDSKGYLKLRSDWLKEKGIVP